MRDNGTLYYLHGDNLGSASLTTDTSGAIVSQNRYYPFGSSRSTTGTRPTDLDFTGQRLDGTGLHFYNARYYDSLLGRFVQADTVTPGMNSQAYNRYAYAINNPIRYTDPSGHCPVCIVAIVVLLVAAPVIAHIPDQPITHAAFGSGPDNYGVTIANNNRALIESAAQAAGFEHPIALAAAIAVQSQWSGLDVIDQVRSDEASLGWGQIKRSEDNDYHFYPNGYNPDDNYDSAIALANKMKYAINDCPGCKTTDLYIAMAVGQNDRGAYAPVDGEYRDWKTFFENSYDASPRNKWRTIFRADSKWPRFQLNQFTKNLKFLQAEGWDLPEDLNLNYMQCFADGRDNCTP